MITPPTIFYLRWYDEPTCFSHFLLLRHQNGSDFWDRGYNGHGFGHLRVSDVVRAIFAINKNDGFVWAWA
jgi:hypothetical protein